jgi:23S rRNA pseudouridine1911/1915/1917 synthase
MENPDNNNGHNKNRRSDNGTYWRHEVRGGGERIDIYLLHSDLHLSRNKIKEKIKNEEILVNGEHSKPSYKVKKGDIIETIYSPPKILEIKGEPINLNIIYEDDDIIVINKQPDLVIHPAKGNLDGTLINALLYHCSNLPEGFSMDRPGVVHRLDADTTGVIIFAKSEKAHSRLAMQFQNREVTKIYLALVWGRVPMKKGEINAPIGRHPIKRELMSVTPLGSRESITYFEVLKLYNFASILKVMPLTGRTHQIRVHLSHYGYPIIGDHQYGGREIDILRRIGIEYKNEFKKALEIIERQALHATSLIITHPITGEEIRFNAPLYDDMKKLIRFLNEVNSS